MDAKPQILPGVGPGSFYVPFWCPETTHASARYHLSLAVAHWELTGSRFKPRARW
jgi:hypothetical protein